MGKRKPAPVTLADLRRLVPKGWTVDERRAAQASRYWVLAVLDEHDGDRLWIAGPSRVANRRTALAALKIPEEKP